MNKIWKDQADPLSDHATGLNWYFYDIWEVMEERGIWIENWMNEMGDNIWYEIDDFD